MSLESAVSKISKTMRWYGDTIRSNYKELVPSLMVSTAAAFGGQEVIDRVMETPPEWLLQSGGYSAAFVTGWGTFLGLSYKNNSEQYPNGFISKEMGKTFGEAFSADYVADLVSYTPTFLAVNHQLLKHDVDPGLSGLASAGAASTTYFFVMCALYDRSQALTQKINNGIKKLFGKENKIDQLGED